MAIVAASGAVALAQNIDESFGVVDVLRYGNKKRMESLAGDQQAVLTARVYYKSQAIFGNHTGERILGHAKRSCATCLLKRYSLLPDGNGKFQSSEILYEGPFYRGSFHSPDRDATLQIGSTEKYVGRMQNGVRSGAGKQEIYHAPTNRYYVRFTGEWRNNKPYSGTFYDPQGKITQKLQPDVESHRAHMEPAEPHGHESGGIHDEDQVDGGTDATVLSTVANAVQPQPASSATAPSRSVPAAARPSSAPTRRRAPPPPEPFANPSGGARSRLAPHLSQSSSASHQAGLPQPRPSTTTRPPPLGEASHAHPPETAAPPTPGQPQEPEDAMVVWVLSKLTETVVTPIFRFFSPIGGEREEQYVRPAPHSDPLPRRSPPPSSAQPAPPPQPTQYLSDERPPRTPIGGGNVLGLPRGLAPPFPRLRRLTIRSFADLVKLDISDNRFREFPREIREMPLLEVLYGRYNMIRTIPSWLCSMANLREIQLDSNRIQVIPTEIGQLQHLEDLSLRSNEITALPAELFNISSLRTLDLSGNRLLTIPDAIGNAIRLTRLSLDQCGITQVPDSIGRLQLLKNLRLGSNSLRAIPQGVFQLSRLTELELWSNPILRSEVNSYVAAHPSVSVGFHQRNC